MHYYGRGNVEVQKELRSKIGNYLIYDGYHGGIFANYAAHITPTEGQDPLARFEKPSVLTTVYFQRNKTGFPYIPFLLEGDSYILHDERPSGASYHDIELLRVLCGPMEQPNYDACSTALN